ncbi:MAG: AAC(3)-I family aminoglycoside N-acetyltransferase [Albidovulum sp.]
MADYRVTELGAGELGLMRSMLTLFGRAFEEPEIFAANPPDDNWLGGLLADKTFIALAALQGDTVIGGLAAYVLTKYESPRREIYIYDLAVDEPHRRRGVATALIRHLQEIARDRGAWVIFVQADYIDPPAIALYESLGQREEVLHFDIPPAAG